MVDDMKFRKWAPLVVLAGLLGGLGGLGGWQVLPRTGETGHGTKETGHGHRGRERKPSTHGTKASRADGNGRESEQAAMVQVRAWLYATESDAGPREARSRMRELVKELSLERVKALLADRSTDPTYLDDPGAPPLDAGSWRSFPYRLLLAAALWERYGMLAPEEALTEAFSGKSEWHRGHDKSPLLAGVAQVDPERALAFIRNPPEELHLGLLVDMRPLMDELVKHSAQEALQILPAINASDRPRAYAAYLMAMDPQFDWAQEAERLKGNRQAEGAFEHTSGYLAGMWARQDPAAAFAWMKGQGMTRSGYHTAIGFWMEEDVAGAKAWLKDWEAPSGETKAELLRNALLYVLTPSLEPLVAVLELTGDQDQRDKTASLTASQWMIQMGLGKEVRDYLESTPLISPEGRKQMEGLW